MNHFQPSLNRTPENSTSGLSQKLHTLLQITGLISLGILTACTTSQPNEAYLAEGLSAVPDSSLDQVYRREDQDFSQYSALKISACTASFREHWQRDQNQQRRYLSDRISDKDVEKLSKDLAERCDTLLQNAFGKDSKFTLLPDNHPDVAGTLLIKPALTKVDIHAPDVMSPGSKRDFTRSAGEMTLELEFKDAVSGKLVARATDRSVDPEKHDLEWTSSVTNRQATDRIMKRWFKQLQETLHALGVSQ